MCLQVKVFMELIPICKIENEQYLCTSIHDRLVEIEMSVGELQLEALFVLVDKSFELR